MKIARIIIYIILSTLLISSMVDSIFANEKKCKQEIAVKNSPGNKKGFGAIWKYPGKMEPSVWFPIVPRAIGIDSKGNIYVGDSVNYRVMKFNEKGDFLLEFKLQPPVREVKPEISHIIQDIGIDKDDNVYVWNYFEDRVEIYDQKGKFTESVSPDDDKQKGVFTKTSKGRFSKYIYEITSYQKQPHGLLHSITVFDVSDKLKKMISSCGGVELAADEDGGIYAFDYKGNIYTFDDHLNVIRINPFKESAK